MASVPPKPKAKKEEDWPEGKPWESESLKSKPKGESDTRTLRRRAWEFVFGPAPDTKYYKRPKPKVKDQTRGLEED